jgi:hypothetical protein
MTLTDLREALADQSNFIGCLVGLAGLARVVHALAGDGQFSEAGRSDPPRDSDDFVHVLLGLASLGGSIERLANSAAAQPNPTVEPPPPASTATRWLR